VHFVVYARFFRTIATNAIAITMIAAAPAISKVSVPIPVPGFSTTVEGEAVGAIVVGASVGSVLVVGVAVGSTVGATDSEPTTM